MWTGNRRMFSTASSVVRRTVPEKRQIWLWQAEAVNRETCELEQCTCRKGLRSKSVSVVLPLVLLGVALTVTVSWELPSCRILNGWLALTRWVCFDCELVDCVTCPVVAWPVLTCLSDIPWATVSWVTRPARLVWPKT
jgi:hypothetical protein